MMNIGLIAEYNPIYPPHIATTNALAHTGNALNVTINYNWISTNDLNEAIYSQYDGWWIAPGSPYKNMTKLLWAIQYARENNFPLLGSCGGFQHMIIEYARNVLGIKEANHQEYDPYASNVFISKLTCSLVGRTMNLSLTPNSKVASYYGCLTASEQYYCDFGVNPEYIDIIQSGPMLISGSDNEGEVRIIEHPKHPFFISTLFVPQFNSTMAKPHPLINAFIESTLPCK